MTYADFLLMFLIAPLAASLVALGVLARRRLLDRRFVALTGALTLVALLYMAPWDHTAAVWGLWTWAPGRTWGLRWWDVPPEEYLFCALEALLASTLVYAALRWRQRRTPASAPATSPAWPPLPPVNAVTLPLAGLLAIELSANRWAYLPFLLVWALPIIILQWALGGRYLWRTCGVWAPVSLALCVWFTLADAIAIAAGVWRFDSRALLGPALGPVPLEEILFYLLTSLMVTQGFIALWEGYADRRALTRRARLRLAWLRGPAQHALEGAEPHDER